MLAGRVATDEEKALVRAWFAKPNLMSFERGSAHIGCTLQREGKIEESWPVLWAWMVLCALEKDGVLKQTAPFNDRWVLITS